MRRVQMTGVIFALALTGLVPAALAANKCPNVVIVLDKSGSMAWYPDGSDASCYRSRDCNTNETCDSGTGLCSGSRILTARRVIQNVLTGQNGASAPNPDIRFGFTSFPSNNSCGASPANPLQVACGYSKTSAIVSTVNGISPGGATPTSFSLDAIRADPAMADSDRPRYVLLVTDGEPNCVKYTDQTDPEAEQKSITAVQNLLAAGVRTFVVGFGSGTQGSSTLNQMAQAGQYPDAGNVTAFQANDEAGLSSALQTVLQKAGELGGSSCDPCQDVQCGAGKICVDNNGPTCITDPWAACRDHSCPSGTYCRVESGQAQCVHGCATTCAAGQICADGQCKADPCVAHACNCPSGQVADENGVCQPDQCGQLSGHCPADAPYCSRNTCSGLFGSGSGSSGGTTGSTGGSGGSATAGNGGGGGHSGGCSSGLNGAAFAGLALVALALLSRRRKD